MNAAVDTNSPLRVLLLLNGYDFDYPLAKALQMSVVELAGGFVVSLHGARSPDI